MSIKEAIQTRKDVAVMKFETSKHYQFGKVIWPKVMESKDDPDVAALIAEIIDESEKSNEHIFYTIVGEVSVPIVYGSGLKGKELGVAVVTALHDRLF